MDGRRGGRPAVHAAPGHRGEPSPPRSRRCRRRGRESGSARSAAAMSSRSASVSASQTSTVPHRSAAELGDSASAATRSVGVQLRTAPWRGNAVEQVDDRRRADRLVHIRRRTPSAPPAHRAPGARRRRPSARAPGRRGRTRSACSGSARAQRDQLGRDRPSERRVDLLVDPGCRRQARVERGGEAAARRHGRPPRLRVDHGDVAVRERPARIEVHEDRQSDGRRHAPDLERSGQVVGEYGSEHDDHRTPLRSPAARCARRRGRRHRGENPPQRRLAAS